MDFLIIDTNFFPPLQNANEDTDDMFDHLFDRYGKVVYRRNDKKTRSEEVDDDAESLSCKLISQTILSKILSLESLHSDDYNV